MSRLAIPFNITILQLTDQMLTGIKPVRVLDTFDGMSKNFHEDGLFSQSIFGRVGEQVRNKRFSYIDIKLHIFHPILYTALKEVKSLYAEIMAGKAYATWDPVLKDFVKVNSLSGETGYSFFVRFWHQIKFEATGSEKRKNNIAIIQKYKDAALTDKIVVLPAGLRDFEITGDGRESENEFNSLYRRILAISSPIHKKLITADNIKQYDNIRNSLQNAFNEVYDKLKSMLEGKHKLIMGKWVKRGIFNGTRNVITTTNIKTSELGRPSNITVNHTVVGLYQYLKATLPVSKFQIKNGFLSKVFPGPSAPAILVDKGTLKAVPVKLKPHHYDAWMSEEGLEATINSYGEEYLRPKPIEIEGYWLGLIYKGPNAYRLFQDIDELPEGLSKDDVYPITFTELLYLSVYQHADKYPAFVTRYPITGFGSIYPSYIYLKPTVTVESRGPLGDDWKLDKSQKVAHNFPVGNLYVNAMSPSSTKLKGLVADFKTNEIK